MEQAQFKRFDECTKEDMNIIADHMQTFSQDLPMRVLEHLKLLDGDFGGFPVHRLEHCLQTATRAHLDGRDEEYVVCCLLHDIGDTLGTFNHGAIAAAIVQPFVSEANRWMMENHSTFQGYYFFEHVGADKNARDKFKDHEHYEHTKEFIEKYDMPAFDKDYDSMPLSDFVPMVKRVLRKG
ncbi:MAG: putative HD phosphohydrolase [Candidatus Azotimanducaceae bacterium]|jgi:predicted HD phosphohydrolase